MDAIGAALSSGDDDDEADTEVREDGTACHWLAAEVWDGRPHAVGQMSPNHRVLTEDMYDAVDIYHGVLNSWPGVVPVLEKTIPSALANVRDGTPDAWAYNATTRTLYVADLKYGFGFVEVWENLQLIIYALSIIKMLMIADIVVRIEFYIVQPRSNHRDGIVRKWITDVGTLEVWGAYLQTAANNGQEEGAHCTPNPGCTHCAARFGCVALQASAMEAVHQSYSSTPHVLTELAVGNELRLLQDAQRKLEARITGLEQQAEFALRNGKRIPGYALRSGRGRTTWLPEFKDGIVTLGKLYHADVAKPLEPMTPKKAIAAGIPTAVVEQLSFAPDTGLRLVKEDKFEVAKKVAKHSQ